MLAARMINEFVYCPRLFWLEQVAGEFVDNEHTLDGHRVHRNVDKPGGRIAAPTEEEGDDASRVWEARSLWLSDAEIGVSAKLDLVEEADNGAVYPVDTKRGSSNQGALWPSDRVQLTLQAMLLKAAGYQVEQIAAWYHTERKRVYTPLTDELIQEARQAVYDANVVAEQVTPPMPLLDSPKCFGCSLNMICLPDETTYLCRTEENLGPHDDFEELPVRRVIPPRVDARPVYVQSYKAQVRLSQNSLKVEEWEDGEPKHHEVGLEQVSHVNLMGNVRITTPAIKKLLDRGVPVSWFSGGGWFYGTTRLSTDTRIDIRIEQFRAADDARALATARVFVADKIANGRTFLRRNLRDRSDEQATAFRAMMRLRDQALRAESPEELLGYEGSAARSYWKIFDEMMRELDERLGMNGRNRRPPEDPVNALLSYGYGVLTRDCVQAVAGVGLDPHLGMYHTTHHGRPSMALDLMEPFRPLIIDSVVWSVLSRGEVAAKDFIRAGQAVRMKPHARKALLRAYERRMDEMVTHPVFGYRVTYRQLLTIHARLLGRFFTGEIPEPPSFRTR